MNNRGFTLVELLATIIILGLVVSIGGISVSAIMEKTRDKDLDSLKENIKDAAEAYYQECVYGNTLSCTKNTDGSYTVTIADLVKYGFLTSNNNENSSSNDNIEYDVVNPKDESKTVDYCEVTIKVVVGESSKDKKTTTITDNTNITKDITVTIPDFNVCGIKIEKES